MGGDAVCARVLAEARRIHGIGFNASARLPNRGNVVNVDIKPLPPDEILRCWHFCHALGWQHRFGACVKKLAILFLLVASCTRSVVVSGPPTAAVSTAAGAATPRDAVKRFMTAARSQDLQEMGLAWGTTGGPELTDKESADAKHTREQREIVMMCYLKHDTYQVTGEAPGMNEQRVLAVEVKFKELTRAADFTVTRSAKGRWFVQKVDIEKLRDICARKA